MMTLDLNHIKAKVQMLDHTDPAFESKYGDILNLLQDFDYPDLKNELIKFAETIGYGEIAKVIPPNRITVEGKIAFCINYGARLADASFSKVKNFLESWRPAYEDSQDQQFEDVKLLHKIKITNALIVCRTLISQAINECATKTMNIRELAGYVRETVKKHSLDKTAIVKELESEYRIMIVDVQKDSSVHEWLKPLQIVVETLGLITNNRKSLRQSRGRAKARKLGQTDQPFDRKGEKAAAKLNFKEEDDTLGIRSIDPTNIVGADIAVVFNTKNRHCEVYRAKDGCKLSVQGARITNFDEQTSVGKTLRKPDKDLPRWTSVTSIRRIDVLLQDINGKNWLPTGKMNKNCVIIKVM